ncbi:MAG: hypothetical protein PHR47_01870 [Candidatus Pacebacteria bacterium]|nr:hypothetical protein [Candidatus Paceibacterota bacterium]
MFDNSKIDNSGLVGGKPITNYDTEFLEKDGFKLKYELNSKNPVYQQVIDECKSQNVSYKIMEVEDNKKHIWIKE